MVDLIYYVCDSNLNIMASFRSLSQASLRAVFLNKLYPFESFDVFSVRDYRQRISRLSRIKWRSCL